MIKKENGPSWFILSYMDNVMVVWRALAHPPTDLTEKITVSSGSCLILWAISLYRQNFDTYLRHVTNLIFLSTS